MPKITPTALNAPANVDEVTLTKSGAGVLSVKSLGIANAQISATAVIEKSKLDATTAYPAGNGSAITNVNVAVLALGAAKLINANSTLGTDYPVGATYRTRLTARTNGIAVTAGAVCRYYSYGGADSATILAEKTDGQNSFVDSTGAAGQYPDTNSHFIANSTAPAINDNFSFSVNLLSGTYNIKINGYKYNDSGVVECFLDGVSKGTFDLYNAATVLNQYNTFSLGAVNGGTHTIMFKVTSKNASSSGYWCRVSEFMIEQTA